jgi:hypothetical protein
MASSFSVEVEGVPREQAIPRGLAIGQRAVGGEGRLVLEAERTQRIRVERLVRARAQPTEQPPQGGAREVIRLHALARGRGVQGAGAKGVRGHRTKNT